MPVGKFLEPYADFSSASSYQENLPCTRQLYRRKHISLCAYVRRDFSIENVFLLMNGNICHRIETCTEFNHLRVKVQNNMPCQVLLTLRCRASRHNSMCRPKFSGEDQNTILKTPQLLLSSHFYPFCTRKLPIFYYACHQDQLVFLRRSRSIYFD